MLGLARFAALVAIWSAAYVLVAWLHRRGMINRDWQRDILAIGVLVLVILAFYWPLFFDQTWIPKGGGDLASFIYPLYAFSARWLKQGIVPLWNPHLYLGMPFAADNQSGLFYPVNLVFLLFSRDVTYEVVELLSVTHVFLAGVFSYLFLRDLPSIRVVEISNSNKPIARIPALAGSIVYMLSDVFVVHPGNLNIIATAAWVPLALLCVRRTMRHRSWQWAAGTGLVMGTAALAGHAQMFLYLGMAVALYGVYQLYIGRGEGWGVGLGRLGLLALAGAVAFGSASVSLIPSYDMTRYTIRASMSYEEASAFSIPPAGLVGILMPGFFGRGTGPFWGPWPRTELGYVGVLPLLLALVAIAMTWRHSDLTRFWFILGSTGLLIALGSDTIVHGLTYALIPLFRQLRVPARAILLFDLAIAMLAASALDLLQGALSRRMRRILASLTRAFVRTAGALAVVGLSLLGHAVITSRMSVPADVLSQHITSMGSLIVFLLLLGAGLGGLVLRRAGLLHPRTLGILAVAVITLDLLSLGAYTEVEPNDPLIGYRHDDALTFLRSDPEIYRVETTAEIYGGWAPDWALLYGMDDLNGIWNPLRLGAYDVLTWIGIQRDDPFYNLYNVKYLITGRDTAVPAHFELVFDEGKQLIYRNTQALPRAFLVYDVLFANGDISALGMARSPDFDPSAQIILKKQSSAVLFGDGSDRGGGQVSILERGPNHINLRVTTSIEGYLFVSEMWMPGWVAYVDEVEQDVLQANYTFRAVLVPPGTHQVRMAYRPTSWFVGLSITVATLLVLLLWSGWSLVGGRSRKMVQSADRRQTTAHHGG